MSKSKVALSVVSVVGVALLAAACTSGGFTFPPGLQCSDGYNPFNTDAKGSMQKTFTPAQKLIFDDKATTPYQSLPAGTYKYSTATLFYVANQTKPGSKGPLMMQMSEGLNSVTNVMQAGTSCVRNAPVGKIDGIVLSADAVSDMKVVDQSNITVTPRHLGYSVLDGKISVCENPVVGQTCGPVAGTPAQEYPSAALSASANKPIEYYMVQNSPNDFEIRSHYIATDKNGTPIGNYYVSTHMTYTNP